MTPAGTSNELDVQNGWEENTHTLYCTHSTFDSPRRPVEVATIEQTQAKGYLYYLIRCNSLILYYYPRCLVLWSFGPLVLWSFGPFR